MALKRLAIGDFLAAQSDPSLSLSTLAKLMLLKLIMHRHFWSQSAQVRPSYHRPSFR